MLLSNLEIESRFKKELGYIPTDVEILKNFLFGSMKKLLLKEQEAFIKKDKCFPFIFKGNEAIDDFISEVEDYVMDNLGEYIGMYDVNVQKFDRTKVVYWLGMYIFEKLDSSYGIEFLQEMIIKEIYEDTKYKLDSLMIGKINSVAQIKDSCKRANKEKFLLYYGRFGLYHALKQTHRTLCSNNNLE